MATAIQTSENKKRSVNINERSFDLNSDETEEVVMLDRSSQKVEGATERVQDVSLN